MAIAPMQIKAPLRLGHLALQYAPRIPEPPLGAAVFPVLGSGWQAGKDLQEGHYAGAVFNGTMAGAEIMPEVAAVRTASTVKKVNKALEYEKTMRAADGTILKSRPLTGKNVQKAYSKAGFTGGETGMEAHHTSRVADIPRPAGMNSRQVRAQVENWRNHPVFIQPLPIDIHRRLEGAWNGVPRLGPIARTWYGSADWAKDAIIGATGYVAGRVEDLARKHQPPPRKP